MRRLVLLVYGLVFVTELTQAAIVPLLPTFSRQFSLTEVETGALLSAMTFATVVVAVPIGIGTDRFGARPLTLAAGGLLVVACLGQAFAPSFPTLLAARVVFGVAFGTVWTAALILISSSPVRRRSAAMGGTVAVGGAAHLVGPAFAGVFADLFGVTVPFTVIAVAAALVTGLLALTPDARVVGRRAQPLLETLRAVRGQPLARSALAVMALIGLVGGIVNLLVPLRLAENGLSAGGIGAIFSAGAVVWIVASSVAARLGDRVLRVPLAGTGLLLLGAVFLLPLVALSTAAMVAFLLLHASFRAPLSTIVYPLAEAGARLAGIGGGVMLGLVNVLWGTAAVVGPLAGGALAQTAGERWSYGATFASCFAVGAWILLAHRRRAAREAEARPAPAPVDSASWFRLSP